jgi:hypothetical protein
VPACPPGCFFCLGAISSLPMIPPPLAAPEPALENAGASHLWLAPQTNREQLVPPAPSVRMTSH